MKVLTAAQKGQLDELGFIGAIPVLSEGDVSRFRRKLEEFEIAHAPHIRKLVSQSQFLSPWICDFVSAGRVLDVYEDLFGADLMLRGVAWRNKGPDNSTFAGWHQDTAAGVEYTPRHVHGMLALSPCSLQTGCLRVVPRSHLGPVLNHEDKHDPTSLLARGQEIVDDFDRTGIVDLELKPGELAIFDSNLIHGSSPNQGPDRRLAAILAIIPASSRRNDGSRDPVIAVRGRDRLGNFQVEPRPGADCTELELAAWRRAVEKRASNIYRKSTLEPLDSYGGTRNAAAYRQAHGE